MTVNWLHRVMDALVGKGQCRQTTEPAQWQQGWPPGGSIQETGKEDKEQLGERHEGGRGKGKACLG